MPKIEYEMIDEEEHENEQYGAIKFTYVASRDKTTVHEYVSFAGWDHVGEIEGKADSAKVITWLNSWHNYEKDEEEELGLL